jgi:tetratricopeptide (TPR) repeat protein
MKSRVALLVGAFALVSVSCGNADAGRIAAMEAAAESILADGQPDAAVKFLESAIPMDGGAEYGALRIIRGRALMAVGRALEAEQLLTRALNHDAHNPSAYRFRAISRLMQGQGPAAKQDIERAIELQPHDPTLELVHGQILIHLQEYSEAVTVLGRCIEAVPDYAKPYVARGNAYIQLQRYAEALGDFNRAISLRSTPEALFNRGVLLAEPMNDRAAGCTDLRAAVACGTLPPVAVSKAAALCPGIAPVAGGVAI